MGTPRRDPSFVDRRRLDSDVRAFLRQPSTPWMVFDRDTRPAPSADLAPGAVLTSAATSVLPDHGVFPPPRYEPPMPSNEASTAAVVSEVAGGEHEDPHVANDDRRAPSRDLRGRILAMAIGTGIGLLVFGGSATVMLATRADDASQAPTTKPRTSAASTSMAAMDIPPPDLDPKPVVETTPAPPKAAVASVDTSKGKFGRLSITAAARSKQVYLDGKRLLGTGARSFTVMCGPHTIAVGTKADAKDSDVPCGGELVVSQ